MYSHLFAASCFCVSVKIHAPNKTCPNQLKKPVHVPPLFFSFPRGRNRGRTRATPPLSGAIRRHCVVTAAPGCGSHATTGRWRHCTAIACPDMYRCLLYLHHRSDGTLFVYSYTICVGDHMCSTVWCSFFRLASNQNGNPPSSVRVSRDSTAIAYDVAPQAVTFAGHLARVPPPPPR